MSGPPSGDVTGHQEVIKDGVEDVGEGPGPGSLLGVVDLDPLRQDGPLGSDERLDTLPLLDLVDYLVVKLLGTLQGWVWDVDEHNPLVSLAELIDLELPGSGYVDVPEVLSVLRRTLGKVVDDL